MSTSPTAAPITVSQLSTMSCRSGIEGLGKPLGTSAISSTPRSPSENTTVTDDAQHHGDQLGRYLRRPELEAEQQRPGPRRRPRPSSRFASDRLVTHSQSFCQVFEPDFSVPVILNSSPDTTLMATPKMNPVSTAADRNSAIQPILSTAMITNRSPGDEHDRGRDRDRVVGARPPRSTRRRHPTPGRSTNPGPVPAASTW